MPKFSVLSAKILLNGDGWHSGGRYQHGSLSLGRSIVGWLPLLRAFIMEFEASDETAVVEVECWEQFVWKEDVEREQSFLDVLGCVFEWI